MCGFACSATIANASWTTRTTKFQIGDCMEAETVAPQRTTQPPPLMEDTSFWGMTVTQFLGAFNDNLFKQLILLLCIDIAKQDQTKDYQGWAGVMFAVPFILFSGFAGYLSDRNSKRMIVLLSKVAEIFIMALGLLAFASGSLGFLFAVLFLMGAQSAYFGPAKYGILPELFREDDLPRANGIVLMTTFLAIIFGLSCAGLIKDVFDNQMWLASIPCIGIAVIGTLTATMIRQTPIAQPGLKFHVSSLAISGQTCRMILQDREFLGVLFASSMFWMIGGVVYPLAINALGGLQLGLEPTWTGLLAASTGVGIAVGCVIAGRASHGAVRPSLVRTGAFGMVACLGLLAFPGSLVSTELMQSWPKGTQIVVGCLFGCGLVAIGLFAGFFTVPLQVFLQAKTPESQKGRIIGAMNLVNWIGIALAGVVYQIGNIVLVAFKMPHSAMFGIAALCLLPMAILYRPPHLVLKHEVTHGTDDATQNP